MKTTDNTILITGDGSGIGRALAEAFHRLGNQIIISGRGQKALDETCAEQFFQRFNDTMHKAKRVAR